MPTKIPWCDETRNPVVGCAKRKVSPACERCYAEATARRNLVPAHGEAVTDGRWNGRLVWQDGQLDKLYSWRKPRRIFMGSMGDLGLVRRSWFRRIWAACRDNPRHDYLFLTKRPEFFVRLVEDVLAGEEPPPWFWLGVTAEDQACADFRIPILLQIPAAVRWVSVEPMLGPLDMERVNWGQRHREMFGFGPDCDWPLDVLRAGTHTERYGFVNHSDLPSLDWVVCGGETGPGARPMDVASAEDLREQCAGAEVPFFFKQLGSATVCDQAAFADLIQTRQFPVVTGREGGRRDAAEGAVEQP